MVAPNASAAVIGIDASRALSRAPTGTEAYSYHLIRALVPLLRERHTVRLYLRESLAQHTQPSDAALPWSGAEDRVIPFPRLWTHVRLSWEMLCAPPDLLFVPAHVLPLIRPRRTLVTVHDMGYRAFPEAHPARQRRYLELSTRWNVQTATHILADSTATRQTIVEAYGTPTEKITVLYPGYEPDLAPVRDPVALEQVRRRYGIPGEYILFLGRIQPRKNLARLIEAFSAIALDYSQLTLILAGPTGWLAEPIVASARALNLSDRVRFPGYIAPEDKAALISGAQLFAYPSLYEGFGFPILEAQACGTPLLTGTTSSLPEVAGEGGLLVDPEDTGAIARGLRTLLEDTALRQRLVDRGFANLTRFSWDRAAQRVSALMEELLAQ